MFQGVEGFHWDKCYRNLIVEPNDGKSLIRVMEVFSLYPIPQCLMADCWSLPERPDIPKVDTPAFYTRREKEVLKKQENLARLITKTRFWCYWEFIKVHTTNATGPRDGPGESVYRAMHYADSHVYLPGDLTGRVVVELLLAPSVYDKCSVKKDWAPSDDLKEIMQQLRNFLNWGPLTSEELQQFFKAKYLVRTLAEAIYYVVREGRPNDLEQICRSDTIINSVDEQRNTPLHITLDREQDDSAAKLIELGAKLNIRNRTRQTANDLLITIFRSDDHSKKFRRTLDALKQRRDLSRELQQIVAPHTFSCFD